LERALIEAIKEFLKEVGEAGNNGLRDNAMINGKFIDYVVVSILE